MNDEIDYAARVQRGIALMDEKWPDWATEINLEKLDIADGSACMTAQYAQRDDSWANWVDGCRALDLSSDSYTEHGFRADDDRQGDYPTLNGLWKAEIERRRAQGRAILEDRRRRTPLAKGE
jgi:hypothetical protein